MFIWDILFESGGAYQRRANSCEDFLLTSALCCAILLRRMRGKSPRSPLESEETEMRISTQERNVLRELAKQVAEIAALPVQQETIALWKALNGLKPKRPMVMTDQIPWHEMEVDGELTLRTEDTLCQRLESNLRRTLYRWKYMRADMVVEPFLRIPKVIRGANFGIGVVEETAVSDTQGDVVSHHYEDQLTTEEDIEKICDPQVELDVEATAQLQETVQGIFDGILDVQMHGMSPSFSPWDRITEWR